MKTIAVDAMGGDNAPIATIQGAVEALNDITYNITLVGKEDIINSELSKYKYDKSRINIVNADDVIENCDTPTVAIKKKKNSSMVVGLNLVKSGEADAFVSAGNTGALLTGATIIVGRIKGIERPALGTLLPTEKGFTMMLDSGATVDAKASYLPQYALMGSIYMENIMNIKNPKVGLVNIGAEREKGNAMVKEAYGLLENTPHINFVGNTEARDITLGDVDIIVCDAFVGNVVLKLMEGFAHSILRILKKELMGDLLSKIGATLSFKAFRRIKSFFEYDDKGGAPFLGLKGLVVKAHGSSDHKAIKGAIHQCSLFLDNDITNKIADKLQAQTDK